MLRSVANYYNISYKNNINVITSNNTVQVAPCALKYDTVSFTGMSKPSQYDNVFEFLAAKILFNKKNVVEEEKLSANNIKSGVEEAFKFNSVYGEFVKSIHSKIKWRPYVPQDVRTFSIDKINEARAERLSKWKEVLETPNTIEELDKFESLKNKLKNNKSLRIVVWDAINSELKDNNRHIPVPFNAEALAQTVEDFEAITPLSRKTRCKDISFIDMYTHRLRDNILTSRGLADDDKVWVRIPSFKKDPKNFIKNVADVEVLSYKNWCTRSSVDKAEDVLRDGDFYIYLERGKNNFWQPLVGMASYENKINQIQGVENNNLIPGKHLGNIKKYIEEQGLKCQTGIFDEGPKAFQQIAIADKLMETRPELEKSFSKAIKDNDSSTMFKYLNKTVNENENGLLEINDYKPLYVLDTKKGITAPYNMMCVDEDVLLSNVEKINGDMILNNKNKLLESTISTFPPKLKEVKGRICCTSKQFEQFGEDMKKVVANPNQIHISDY